MSQEAAPKRRAYRKPPAHKKLSGNIGRPHQTSDIDISRIRALRGPNFWRLEPVIACDVKLGAFEGITSAMLPGFSERLLHCLPNIRQHNCTENEGAAFQHELMVGTHLPHVLEHVALELQTMAGCDVSFGRAVASGDAGTWWVIVGYEEEEVGIESMREAGDVLRNCIDGTATDSDELVARLRDLYENVRLGPSSTAIVEEARRRGIPVRRLNSGSRVQLGLGRNLRRIQATLTDNSSSIAVDIAQDKEETKRLLSETGIPVPSGAVATSLSDALAIAEEIGYPVIVKPLDASHGRGVSACIQNSASLRSTWKQTRRYSSEVLVERFQSGNDYRVLVIGGRMVACAERIPPHVIGDGRSTIAQLVKTANQDPRRGVGHSKILTMLPDDDSTKDFLLLSNRTLGTIPAAGEFVQLRATANLSTGGTSIDRTDEMHPENVTACEMAATAIGLDIAGIDVLSSDISVPFRQNGAVILEVNAAPGIRMHTHPHTGKPRNVAAAILDQLYPPGSTSRIPIIAVTGTNGKTTTVRLIAHLFRNTNQRVGFSTTDGVYVQNRLVLPGDLTGPFGANILLANSTIDIAVLETARGGLLRSGLGFDECDAAVVLNISNDHLGLHGINDTVQMAEVKAVVPSVARRDGHAILNADDPLVFAMSERTSADIVLFSPSDCGDNELLEAHTASGGVSACMIDQHFVIRRGRLKIPIAAEREVPLMQGGAARFQRENILAAAATAYVRGMRYDDIRAGLMTFFPSPTLTPGRVNIIRLASGARVIVDYAHNPRAISGIVDMALRLSARRCIAVIGMPGDRRDADLHEGGRLCACFDYVLVKEDEDLRGRKPNATANLMRRGLIDGGLPVSRIEIVNDESEATRRALAMLTDEDVLVVLAADVPQVLAIVCEQAAPGG